MEQESRVNNPKPWITQLFCRHHGEWFRRQEPYFNLSGETQYKVLYWSSFFVTLCSINI